MIQISCELKSNCPSIRVGYIYFELSDINGNHCFPLICSTEISDIIDLTAQQNIDDIRKLFKACGSDPSRYRPSCDALKRRILSAKTSLSSINPVVDIGNYISLRYGLCVGSYDASCIKGAISFRVGESETYYPGITKRLIKLKGIPAMSDDLGFFGSLYADSNRTCVNDETQTLLMLFFYPAHRLNPRVVQEDTKALLNEYCSIQAYHEGICE